MKKLKKRISVEEKEHLEQIYQKFLNDPRIIKMKEISMHRGSNCYLHSFKVVKKVFKMALNKRTNLDLESMLVASILHDYYLYDWRNDKKLLKGHAKNHPFIASVNADRDFGLNELEKEIIETHMWPINIKNFPKTKEAKIVGFADTFIATIEALTSKRHKAKRQKKYEDYISKLF